MRMVMAALVSTALLVVSSAVACRAEDDGFVKFLRSVSVGAYVDTAYEYNFNNPKSGQNQFRSLDPDHNEFEIHLFQLSLHKEPTLGEGPGGYVGFGVKLSFGEDADRIHAAGLGVSDDSFDLQEAYINLLLPWGNGLSIKAGKFVTLAGYEVIEAKDNPNASRSLLFGLAIPFTHTGVRVSYPIGAVTLTLGLNNGWDVVDDNNDGKTIETQVAVELDRASFYLTGYFGPEADGVDGDWRELITFVGTVEVAPRFSVGFDLDFGWEQDVNVAPDVEENAFWWGLAGYLIYDVSPRLSLVLRAEVFDDSDGFRTGTEQTMWEVTPTVSVKPFADRPGLDNLELRFEYRHDQSDEDVFEKDDGSLTDTQDTFTVQLLYWFTT